MNLAAVTNCCNFFRLIANRKLQHCDHSVVLFLFVVRLGVPQKIEYSSKFLFVMYYFIHLFEFNGAAIKLDVMAVSTILFATKFVESLISVFDDTSYVVVLCLVLVL